MIKNILVPQDGSKHSEAALDYSSWMGKKLKAKLEGIYVVDIVTLEGPFFHDISGSLGFEPFLDTSSKMREIFESKGKEVLHNFAEKCNSVSVENETNLDFGIIVNEICKRTRVADLLIMGRRGMNEDFEYGLLGSATDGVIRKASSPVMIVPDTFKEPASPILAYDGSASSTKALHFAAELTQNLNLTLTVLTVSRKNESDRLINEAGDYLRSYKIETEFTHKKGDAHHEIVNHYKDNNHDILFMGTSHHSRIVAMVLGSTAEYVIRATDGPVILVR